MGIMLSSVIPSTPRPLKCEKQAPKVVVQSGTLSHQGVYYASVQCPSDLNPTIFQSLNLGVDTLENSFSQVEPMRNSNCHSIFSSYLHGFVFHTLDGSPDITFVQTSLLELGPHCGQLFSGCFLLKRTLKWLFQVRSASALITLSAMFVPPHVLPFASLTHPERWHNL